MTSAQLCLDFAAPVEVTAITRRFDFANEARAYWRAGMVTSLPVFCALQDIGSRYTQMLPGVVESITGDLAAVRIYAAPEYGYTIDNYALHMQLAVDVPLHALGAYHGNVNLQRIIDEGRLADGDVELVAAVRSRINAPAARVFIDAVLEE